MRINNYPEHPIEFLQELIGPGDKVIAIVPANSEDLLTGIKVLHSIQEAFPDAEVIGSGGWMVIFAKENQGPEE